MWDLPWPLRPLVGATWSHQRCTYSFRMAGKYGGANGAHEGCSTAIAETCNVHTRAQERPAQASGRVRTRPV